MNFFAFLEFLDKTYKFPIIKLVDRWSVDGHNQMVSIDTSWKENSDFKFAEELSWKH